MDLPADIEEALALAGGNRRELKAVLRHYRQDSLKFRAACFLIANMRWHYSDDSGYCLYSDAKDSDLCDLRRFDRSFLISHVDHAFDVWESSPCAAGLSFCEFCEYILPYRSLAGYPDCFSGAELYDLFGKFVQAVFSGTGMYGCGCDRLSDSPGLRIAGDGGILQCLPGLSRPAFLLYGPGRPGTLVAL